LNPTKGECGSFWLRLSFSPGQLFYVIGQIQLSALFYAENDLRRESKSLSKKSKSLSD
tara:strand:+ start:58 stop:231 length:174 start_codon:yes stop_codon:yes gene_type:complete